MHHTIALQCGEQLTSQEGGNALNHTTPLHCTDMQNCTVHIHRHRWAVMLFFSFFGGVGSIAFHHSTAPFLMHHQQCRLNVLHHEELHHRLCAYWWTFSTLQQNKAQQHPTTALCLNATQHWSWKRWKHTQYTQDIRRSCTFIKHTRWQSLWSLWWWCIIWLHFGWDNGMSMMITLMVKLVIQRKIGEYLPNQRPPNGFGNCAWFYWFS